MAVAHIDVTGDASGNPVTAAFQSDGGFLYRLEGFNMTVNSLVDRDVSVITSHRWATDKSGLGTAAFDLNWIPIIRLTGAFQQLELDVAQLRAIQRFPIGRTDDVALQSIFSVDHTNADTLLFDYDVWFTYWRKEALYQTRFLESFQESPRVR